MAKDSNRPSKIQRVAGVVALLFALYAVHPTPSSAGAAASAPTTLAEAIKAAHFPEIPSPTISKNDLDDAALFEALKIYEGRTKPDDLTALVSFLAANPQSGWASSLYTNVGILELRRGYYSRAIDDLKRAWTLGNTAREPRVKAVVDRAVGELAILYAGLGMNDELAGLLAQSRTRLVTGSATEAIQEASETLYRAKKDAQHLYLCGPQALFAVLKAEGVDPKTADFLHWYNAGPNGTNFSELSKLADKAGFAHVLVFRRSGEAVPIPSVVHWKVGHYAAIVGRANGYIHIIDSAFRSGDAWITEDAINSEASGYLLAAAHSAEANTLRPVADVEAAKVWGKGPTPYGTTPGSAGPQDPKASPPHNPYPPAGSNGPDGLRGTTGGPDEPNPPGPTPTPPYNPPPPPCPLCMYNIGEATVSLSLSDVPVGYSPPIGPSAKVQVFYNQREDSQPSTFSYFNISSKWTLNWLTYITDDPNNPGASVSRYIAGGGSYSYTGYQSGTGQFDPQSTDGTTLVLASQTPITYKRFLADGSIETYAQSDGATSSPRNVFLSQVTDPQGNTLTLNYDGQERLLSLTDATGRQTTFSYDLPSTPLLVTRITDPFGRFAQLAYDTSGRLQSITDVIGLTSSFAYDGNNLVNSLATPYGTTNFSFTTTGDPSGSRFLQITDPMGFSEREESIDGVVPSQDPLNTVPNTINTVNNYLNYRNSFHWDKAAYVAAGCTPTGGCDYTKARIRHFAHRAGDARYKSTTIESVKYPLENRVWYNFPNQSAPNFAGTFNQPSVAARVLDDSSGAQSLDQTAYDTTGYFKLTQAVDPIGRTTTYAYPNHVDLTLVTQTVQGGAQQTIAQYDYNTAHRPLHYTDAAGQITRYTYNPAGQLKTVTDPLSEKTTYNYFANGDLKSIVNANNLTQASFTYDAFDRIRTRTDSEGYTLTYDYDAADRPTKVTYPDGTTDLYVYDKLDLASHTDRQFRTWAYNHDNDGRLTAQIDPMGNKVQFGYNQDAQITSITDPKLNVTQFFYDIEGRFTLKQFADGTTIANTYEPTTSRLFSVLDPLGQTKQYAYAVDGRISSITYLNSVNPTPNVAFFDDPYFARASSMTDGTGATQFTYVPVGTLGALQLQAETGPLANGTVAYTYDKIGRRATRQIGQAGVGGVGPESFGYDPIGRLSSHGSDLGQFTIGYLGQTGQIQTQQLASSTIETSWSYLPNAQDRRLSGINNTGFSAAQYSNYAYSTTPQADITNISETSDAASVYPATLSQTATYNNLNQISVPIGTGTSFDANGNMVSDGQRNYRYDAENRLISISYVLQPGKLTTFTYNGLNQRVAVSSTPAGGGTAVVTSYIWCDSALCQARDASNTPKREYLAEGEYTPGSTPQPYYYAVDQIGTIRRAFAGTTTAPAYSYDPYGNSLQATAPLTDMGYAHMLYNADSGLYLTQYRAYNPAIGRWLSRDPLGEQTDPAANLYVYVNGSPVRYVDRQGKELIGLIVSGAIGAYYGGLGAAIAGGDWESIAAGAIAGGGIGAIGGLLDPTGGVLSGAASAALADAAGQELTNYFDDKPMTCFNVGSTVGAAIGGGVGGAGMRALNASGGAFANTALGSSAIGLITGSFGTLTTSIGNALGSSGTSGCECR